MIPTILQINNKSAQPPIKHFFNLSHTWAMTAQTFETARSLQNWSENDIRPTSSSPKNICNWRQRIS